MASLFYQIENHLAEMINRGDYTPDEAIPTELELCEIYGVSRITVRRAVERLVAARMLYRRRGVGTFVNRIETDGRSLQLYAHMQDVLTFSQQLTAKVFARGLHSLPKAVARTFGVEPDVELYRIAATNAIDGKPYAVTYSYLSRDLTKIGPRIQMKSGKTSVRYIEELAGVRVRSGRQTIEPSAATPEVAKQLKIASNTPLLGSVRSFFSDAVLPIEVVEVYYHPARYRLNVQLLGSDSFIDSPAPNGSGK